MNQETQETKSKSKKKLLLLLLLLLLAVALGVGGYIYTHQPIKVDPNLDTSAVDWNGLQKLDSAGKGSGSKISIPCFEGMTFKTNQTTQKVNLYNPETNQCYFVISLFAEEELIWKSEMIAPNKGFYEIELNQTLASGNYLGSVVYECYDIKTLIQLNGGAFDFDLTVR